MDAAVHMYPVVQLCTSAQAGTRSQSYSLQADSAHILIRTAGVLFVKNLGKFIAKRKGHTGRIGNLSKPRRRRQRKRHQTKGIYNERNNSCARALFKQ